MDQQRDFATFKRLVSRLCVTFDKFANDEIVEAWWKALRTERYAELERRVEAYIANAGETTKFPRPGQFRTTSVASYDPKDEAREKRFLEDSAKNWRAFMAQSPTTAPIRHKLAMCARIQVTERPDSAAYAEAIAEEAALLKQLSPFGRFSADL